MKMNWSPDVYRKAWDFATLAHHGQTYGGPIEGQRIEYLNHIGSVAMELVWAMQGEEHIDANLALQCGLLHDVLEDTPTSYAELAAQFGEPVAQGVQALSKDETLPTKQEQMLDSLRRIKLQAQEIWMVKMADRITNLYAAPFYWTQEKKLAYQAESAVIYEALHSANSKLAARLQESITQYVK